MKSIELDNTWDAHIIVLLRLEELQLATKEQKFILEQEHLILS
jgi:hypothetical protein